MKVGDVVEYQAPGPSPKDPRDGARPVPRLVVIIELHESWAEVRGKKGSLTPFIVMRRDLRARRDVQ